MIIDFVSENIQGSTFTTSQHFCGLNSDCLYEIGIKQIVLNLKSNTTQKTSLWMLTTNLIDRCSTNPNRCVSYFALEKLKNQLVINFPSVDFFLLERIHTYPSFEFQSLFGSQQIEIANVIVRAEVRKKCLVSANH